MKKFLALFLAFMCIAALTAEAKVMMAVRHDNGVENANRFTLALAKSVIAHQQDASDNMVVSPYNALTALALAASGTGGETRAEFTKSLFDADAAALDEKVKTFTALNSGILSVNKGHVDLLTASGIWVNQKMAALKPDYATAAKENFDAELSADDFADPKTLAKINGWASDNTKGLITRVLQSLDPRQALIIASALYFKGEWTFKFDKSLTEDKSFTADGGKGFRTPMMHRDFDEERQVMGQDRDGYEAVALTYGAENTRSMRLVLVRPKDKSLSAGKWLDGETGESPAWLDASTFEDVRGAVELPHLDIKQHHDLIPPLQDLGIKAAFAGGADFTPMATVRGPGLFVSAISHDVVFKTDEDGSEAAAVTTMALAGSAMMQAPRHIDIKFDRSFVFALQDVQTGAVLFLGVVNKPNEEMKPQ